MTRRYGEGKMKHDAGKARLCLGPFPHVGVSLPEEYGGTDVRSRERVERALYNEVARARAFVPLGREKELPCLSRGRTKK